MYQTNPHGTCSAVDGERRALSRSATPSCGGHWCHCPETSHDLSPGGKQRVVARPQSDLPSRRAYSAHCTPRDSVSRLQCIRTCMATLSLWTTRLPLATLTARAVHRSAAVVVVLCSGPVLTPPRLCDMAVVGSLSAAQDKGETEHGSRWREVRAGVPSRW